MTNGTKITAKERAPEAASAAHDPQNEPRLRDVPMWERALMLHDRGVLRIAPDVADFKRMTLEKADEAIENAIGFVGTPLGVIPSLIVNGVEHVVPMTTEERSVIASASKAAKMCAPTGGVTVTSSERPRVPAQIIYADPPDPRSLQRRLFELNTEIETYANDHGGQMLARGGEPVNADAAYIVGTEGEWFVVQTLIFDTRDAMGANAVIRAAERVADFLETHCGLPRRTATICSNHRSGWYVTAEAYWPVADDARAKKAVSMSRFAHHDLPRAVTHNKGIMNGVDAVALATGQDYRAIEASAHTMDVGTGAYTPFSSFALCSLLDGTPAIHGTLSLPIPCGTVGGATSGPYFSECLTMLGNPSARQLAEIMAATGLVQNFAALWSLVGEGILESHERLRHENERKTR